MFGLFKKKETYKFYNEEYSIYIILRKSTSLRIHDWEVWEKSFKILNEFVSQQPEIMAIRTCQCSPKSSKWLSFGRMIWNEKNNIKWTSKYKQGEFKINDLEFFGTEFWSPSWTVCNKGNFATNIFMNVDSMENGQLKDLFNESLLVAVKGKNHINQALIEEISESIGASYIIKGKRPWGKESTSISYTDALNDFSVYQILNKENKTSLEIKQGSNVLGSWEILKKL